jgi:hypothetical protein
MADAVIPRFRAERAAVPGTYDPLRRPGSSGQRYFSDMQYANPNMPQRIFDPKAEGYETQADYDARFNRSMDAATDAARDANREQVAGLKALNLSNLARQQRPAAQTLTDEEVIKTFTDIQNNPAYNTERKQIGQSVGAMNRYNVSPERASSLMNVPLSDVNEMMGPYYRAFGEAKPEGIANLLSKQTELVSEASRRLPVGMTPAQRSVTGALNDAPNDMVAKLLNMGIFTPETAAQFYQSRYPGLTAEQVQEALAGYNFAEQGPQQQTLTINGMARGGEVQGDLPMMYDENSNPALADRRYEYLTTKYNMGPMDPASEEGRRKIENMERERRRESTRTPLEYLLDMLTTSKVEEELRLRNTSGDRRRFNQRNPGFLGELEALKEARERIIKEQNNRYAQGGLASVAPQGMYLGGPTDGMADQIPATIDNRQPAALSDGEFVIPADVVSHLGNGNSDAGAKQLYGMMDRIRKARTGSTEQGKQINPNKFLA